LVSRAPKLHLRIPRRQPTLPVGAKIVCEFRNEHATFIGKLPIGNARTVRFFGQADFQAVVVWKDNFAVEEDARKMQDKNSEQHKKRGPVGHEWRVAGIFCTILARIR
jgi:hypothetical protein